MGRSTLDVSEAGRRSERKPSASQSRMPSVGKIKRVALREVWTHEALDFTTWLEQNVDILHELLDVTLVNVEREQSAGSFSVDLVAEDEAGNPVVIENQLEKSNHDHLGKLITYLTALEAKVAVWIVSDPRPEHIRAVSWLKESSSASFYLVRVEAIQIEDSAPAPLLNPIVGPTAEAREIGATKQELAGRYKLRHAFWESLLVRAKEKTRLHAARSPGKYHYILAGAGKRGLSFNYVIHKHDSQVELYIDRGQEAATRTPRSLRPCNRTARRSNATSASPSNGNCSRKSVHAASGRTYPTAVIEMRRTTGRKFRTE
jgi:Domain of unknown function (DUF4268)